MKVHFKTGKSVACLAILVALQVISSTAQAATFTYPSAACNADLQACINAAAPGDAVEVATASPISEQLFIDKSLILRPATGFSPVLNNGARVNLFNLGSASNSIVFEGFTIDAGEVRVNQVSTQAFDVRIRNLVFTDTNLDQPAIDLGTNFPGPYGPVTFEITDNVITVPDTVFGAPTIVVNGGHASTFSGTIQGNVIHEPAGGDGTGAILVANAVSQLDVDVIGNHVTGANYNSGISFFQFGDGDAHVRFVNNLVEGQGGNSGQPAAMGISVTEGDATFMILNNTLVNSEHGIAISGRDDLGATWSGVVANNVVDSMSEWGITIDDPSASVVNEHNIIHAVGGNFFAPGPGTLFIDPQFVGGGDYRLTPGSPAQNAGNDALVPPDITIDLIGQQRIQGAAVDMGAYEIAVPEPASALLFLIACGTAIAISRRCRFAPKVPSTTPSQSTGRQSSAVL
jgi:hypothetical protein